jgi:hypothetical protein
VYSLYAQCLDGLFTIRAYRAAPHLLSRMGALLDESARWDLAEQAAGRWLSLRLAAIGSLLTLACALGGVLLRDALGAATVGLTLSYALLLSFQLVMVTRISSQVRDLNPPRGPPAPGPASAIAASPNAPHVCMP